ncbi:MAG: hypothetical protein H7296_08935 [Bacteroidia bacterium]|nr:hypothetical protein [Bacteroidia bacterium]
MKKLIPFFTMLFIFNSCKKDLNFNKFDNFSFRPEFGVPIGLLNLEMKDLLKEDSNIAYDSDGLIKFILRQDSIAVFPADSFVNIPALPPIQFRNSLGLISIDSGANISESKSLSEMSSNFATSTQNALSAADGQITVFPAINDQNSSVSSLGLSSTQFTNISLANGYLIVDFRNKLKVTIEVIRINIFNTVPFQNLVGQLVFTNVPPNGHKKDSLNLAGVTLSSSLGYSLPQFKSYASNSPVLVNLEDAIQFDVNTSNMKAYAGTAVFPNYVINTQSLNVDFVAGDPSTRIKNAEFESGVINYVIASTVREQLQIKITIPGAMKNGLPFAPVNLTVNNSSVQGQINIADVVFDMGLDNAKPYNKMKVNIEPRVVSSNQIKTFDSSQFINASFTFGTLKIKEIGGYLGNKEINITPSEFAVDFLSRFSNGLPIDNPKIKITSSNSIGVPVTVSLYAEGISATGFKQPLNGPSFIMDYPSAIQKGQVVKGSFTYDKNNSSIVQLLNMSPKKVSFSGKASINATSNNNYTNFITKGSFITVGYQMEMPLTLKTNNFVLQDTTDNPFFDVDKITGKLIKLKFGDTANITSIELLTKVENGIPFDGELYLYFADKMGIIYDSTETKTLLKSAIPNMDKTTTASVSLGSVLIDNKIMRKMIDLNLGKMIFKVLIKTYANGTQPVNIYSSYKVKIGLSAKVKMKFAVSKK